MSQDFEKEMRDRLRAASGKELVPGFDEEALWNRLEPRIRRKKSAFLLRPWVTHAAAAAAGLALGWFALRHVAPTEEHRPVAVQAPATPVHDTVRVMAAPPDESGGPKPPAELSARRPAPAAAKAVAAALPAAVQAPDPDTVQPSAAELVHQAPVAAEQAPEKNKAPLRQPPVQVVHLLDIDNEARQLYSVPAPATRKTNPVSFFLNRSRVPDQDPSAHYPTSPLSFLD